MIKFTFEYFGEVDLKIQTSLTHKNPSQKLGCRSKSNPVEYLIRTHDDIFKEEFVYLAFTS